FTLGIGFCFLDINLRKKRHESPQYGIIYLSLNLTKGAFRVDVFLFCGEKPSLSFFIFDTGVRCQY
ncbi:TPA: hypothetical protein ACQP54_001904, partial [Streptococcus pyogenes]